MTLSQLLEKDFFTSYIKNGTYSATPSRLFLLLCITPARTGMLPFPKLTFVGSIMMLAQGKITTADALMLYKGMQIRLIVAFIHS